MKKVLLILIGLTVISCSDKIISKEYYKAHLDEAKEELIKCKNNKDENSLNCDNAKEAIQMAFSEEDDKKVANSFKSKTRNVKDAFH